MIELNENNIEEVLTQLSENPELLKKVPHFILDRAIFDMEAMIWDEYLSDESSDNQ